VPEPRCVEFEPVAPRLRAGPGIFKADGLTIGRQDCGPIDVGSTVQASSRWLREDRAVNDRGQYTWRDERKWRQKANVPFDLAFTLGDLGERANSARCEVFDPGARLGCGEKNRIAGLPFERWLGL
jgi:hypothetical protein